MSPVTPTPLQHHLHHHQQQQQHHLHKPTFDLTALPDELISMCYADLPATDLVALEHVSRRLRHLIAYDSVCWRRCTDARWGHLTTNSVLLPSAARHAGTWKNLYSEKAICDAKNNPWLTLCQSEMLAILDLIKQHPVAPHLPTTSHWSTTTNATHHSPPSEPATPPPDKPSPLFSFSSPASVMAHPAPMHHQCINIVLLIDASSSVTDDDFDAMKNFARALVASLRHTHPKSAVALVQFNQHPKVEISLTPVSKAKLTTAIDNMEQLMGSTDIAAPIRRAREILSVEALPGDRAIVLLTDGQTHADELHESEKEARRAYEEVGARMFTLGVGRDVDELGLGRVASGSEGGMNFTLRRLGSTK
ncbi:Cochlin [Gracilariopsis chorda]|uniref:Cochlin n=1 Tax=Gracilariopsis chorda TaxID=448386 RepID=A0A2V3J2F3_9FLOR|nr:Cochlin [Gracilariopsis chorda]|eukprot:PXF48282.1 Cochlin [Gracilariopsis chorda]